MPTDHEAISTTKRKFAKLMESFTSSTSPPKRRLDASTATTAPSNPSEPSNKRLRLSDFSRASMESLRSARASRLSTDSSIRAVEEKAKPKKTPNYAPWDQGAFLRRLKTFSNVKMWTWKPAKISEVEWAKLGWVLEGWNTVACRGGCEARVAIRLKPRRKDAQGKDIENSEDGSAEVEEQLVDKYRKLTCEAHDEECLWRKGGCKDDILHIPLASRASCEHELKTRYQSLQPLQKDLPPLESITIPEEPPETMSAYLPMYFFDSANSSSSFSAPTSTQVAAIAQPTKTPPRTPPQHISLLLAAYGWTGMNTQSVPLLSCEHCFQRIGLWMYSPSRISEMSEKLSLDPSHLRLNPLTSHREHCPWKDADAQANTKDTVLANLNASETLISTLKRTKRLGAQAGHGASRPQTPAGGEDGDASLARTLTPEEAARQDRELATRWRRLKARMSFRRPKSVGGKSVTSATEPVSRPGTADGAKGTLRNGDRQNGSPSKRRNDGGERPSPEATTTEANEVPL